MHPKKGTTLGPLGRHMSFFQGIWGRLGGHLCWGSKDRKGAFECGLGVYG